MQGIIMQKRGKRWNDKIKLAMCELEGKMQKDSAAGRNDGVWPAPEQVEAWTEQRKRQHSGGQYCSERQSDDRYSGGYCSERQSSNRHSDSRYCSEQYSGGGYCNRQHGGQYCGGAAPSGCQTKEEQKRRSFVQNVMMQVAKSAAFALATLALIQGVVKVLPDSITVSSSVGGRELPIYCVETDKKQVALSFDAAWGNEDTGRILEILQKHNVKVTFFMTGGWVESYPDDVKAILAAGHDLGNHSENHKNMSQLSDEQCQEELMKVHTKVQELTGYEMCLFRPPYGDYDNHVITNAHKCGYYPIQWSIDSLDWKDYGVDDIVKRVVESDKLNNGSIILMHNGAKYTADALESVITGLQDKGYELVPISQLIYKDKYHMKADGTQVSGE